MQVFSKATWDYCDVDCFRVLDGCLTMESKVRPAKTLSRISLSWDSTSSRLWEAGAMSTVWEAEATSTVGEAEAMSTGQVG